MLSQWRRWVKKPSCRTNDLISQPGKIKGAIFPQSLRAAFSCRTNILISRHEFSHKLIQSDYSCPGRKAVSLRSVKRSIMASNRHAVTVTWKRYWWPHNQGPKRVDHLTCRPPGAMEIWHLSLFKWTQTICISCLCLTCAKSKAPGPAVLMHCPPIRVRALPAECGHAAITHRIAHTQPAVRGATFTGVSPLTPVITFGSVHSRGHKIAAGHSVQENVTAESRSKPEMAKNFSDIFCFFDAGCNWKALKS